MIVVQIALVAVSATLLVGAAYLWLATTSLKSTLFEGEG